MAEVSVLGPVDALAPVVGPLLVGLVVLNLAARFLAHRSHVRQAREGGADAISRYPLHDASNVLLVLVTFYYTTLEPHGGVVLSMFVLGTVVADFFEFESRKVEARTGKDLERPKAALAGSVLTFGYALFQTVFFLVAPVWSSIV
jgi:hypothetical protein